MSTQRIDYVRQNIEKFSKKNVANKLEKTPIRTELGQQVNDENRPLNSNTKFSASKFSSSKKANTKPISQSKYTNQTNEANKVNSATDRRQVKTNLINKINNTKNPLSTKTQSINEPDRKLSNDRRLSDERGAKSSIGIDKTDSKQITKTRLSDGRKKSDNKITTVNNKAGRLSAEHRLSNEKATKNDKLKAVEPQSIKTNDKNQLKSIISGSNDKLSHLTNSNQQLNQPVQFQQIKQSVSDKPTKSQVINLNDDPLKQRLALEHELLKLKYLNAKCENGLRKQNQAVIDIVKSIFDLIKTKQTNCLKLEKQVTMKETLIFLLKLSEESSSLLRDLNLKQLESYLKLVSNIINSVLSTFKVNNLKNATNINDILELTTSKLTTDLKMDTVQKFANKHKNFDLVNTEIFETIDHIRLLKLELINEIESRTKSKNIY